MKKYPGKIPKIQKIVYAAIRIEKKKIILNFYLEKKKK